MGEGSKAIREAHGQGDARDKALSPFQSRSDNQEAKRKQETTDLGKPKPEHRANELQEDQPSEKPIEIIREIHGPEHSIGEQQQSGS